MAISSKIEEVILEITKTAGNIYDALKYGIGSSEIPGSSIFEINNLLSTSRSGYPYFGVVETDPLGFQFSYSYTLDRYNINISSGKVAYNNSVIQVPSQSIPIKKEFAKNYSVIGAGSSSFKYGITIGFPIDEAIKATQTWNTFVTSSSIAGSNILSVNDVTIANNLKYPLEAHVGSLYLRFTGPNLNNDGLIIDPSFYNGSSYGVLPYNVLADTPIKFVFSPRLKSIAGFPVTTSNENASDFVYYPPLPKSWLPIGKALVKIPENPIIAGIGTSAYIRTVVDMPTSTSSNPILGDASDISNLESNCKDAINSLSGFKNNTYIQNIIQAIKNYSVQLGNNSSITANQFWSKQPFRATQFYSKGLSYSGLERFEFPYNFAEAYYNTFAEDLQHTFAIFRGDLLTYNSAVLGTNAVSSSSLGATVIPTSNYISSLDKGTQIYGVSVVSNISVNEYQETVPTYTNIVSSNSTNTNYLVEVNWSSVGTTNPMFYHVYKRPNLGTELVEKRLTNSSEILYTPYFTNVPITDTTSTEISNGLTAIKITPNENCFLGGVSLKLGFNAPNQTAATGTTGILINLVSNSGAYPNISSVLSSTELIRYSDISEGFGTYTVKFDTGVNLATGSSYWLVINKGANITTGSGTTALLSRIASGSVNTYYSTNGASWGDLNVSAYLKMRGYLDDGNTVGTEVARGIKLTNRVAFKPRRLSIYVPEIEDLSTKTGLILNGSSTAIAATSNTTIKNDLLVTVSAKLGDNGVVETLTTTIPQGTSRGTRFLLGNSANLFDRVVNVIVNPGTNVIRDNNGPVIWDIYDLITVETEP
jgi:hypothetical protein